MQLHKVSEDGRLLKLKAEGVILPGGLMSDDCPLSEKFGEEIFKRRVLINFEQVDFVNSPGLGWLLKINGSFDKHGGQLAIYAVPSMVRQTFRLVKLSNRIRIAESEARALEMLEDQAK
ncbi:MAG: STAS domain-containing protein [Phycisphaeraceae bacterium]|nr:STAS domain-containing protein [Phycisphaeraceae bacterium]